MITSVIFWTTALRYYIQQTSLQSRYSDVELPLFIFSEHLVLILLSDRMTYLGKLVLTRTRTSDLQCSSAIRKPLNYRATIALFLYNQNIVLKQCLRNFTYTNKKSQKHTFIYLKRHKNIKNIFKDFSLNIYPEIFRKLTLAYFQEETSYPLLEDY